MGRSPKWRSDGFSNFSYTWGRETTKFQNVQHRSVVRAFATEVREEVRMFDPSVGAGTRWRKGTSGNPGGRPKSRLLSEALRAHLGQVKSDDPEHRTWAEAIAPNLLEIVASKSSNAIAAANEVCDRAEGRPPQHLQISDFAADIHARSDAELQFYLDNNRWPSDEEKAMLLTAAPQPTA